MTDTTKLTPRGVKHQEVAAHFTVSAEAANQHKQHMKAASKRLKLRLKNKRKRMKKRAEMLRSKE